MITIDELKVQLADYGKAVKDLEEALAIDASRKRVQELEHTMSRPGFYDDADLSKKVFDEVGDLKGKLSRFEKLQGLYDDAETMLEMLDEEYDPAMIPEAEESVNAVGKAVDELQLMTMLNGEYDHSNAILTFHAGTGGTEAQDWAEMLYRMYNKWASNHGMTVEVLDYQDGDEAGMKSASMMVKGANAYGLLKSENGVHRLVRVSPFDANARRQTSFASLEVMPELDNTIQVDIRPEDIEMQVYRSSGASVEGKDSVAVVVLAVQHGHQLQFLHSLAHGVHGLLGLGDHGGVVLLVQHFQHGLGVIVQALQLFKAVQFALQVADLVKHLLAQLGIIVKAGAGHGVLQLLHALAACFNGQCFFQVLNGLGVLGQLHFQFISRDHSLSSSRSRVSIITDNVPGSAYFPPCQKTQFIHRYFISIPRICDKVKRKNTILPDF